MAPRGADPRRRKDTGARCGSRRVLYPNTGHLVLWEQAGRIATDLAAFLATLE
ncbi:hypothetical protein [Arthrobacter sp. MYb227]|uniref:hypothetical protein n=1 Tax=Arthrobacter sp. MYb227 TaxID=1848601 RepID=UPI0015E34E98|nr:hypothetical protein [Arthrobacter sp. MYb227]